MFQHVEEAKQEIEMYQHLWSMGDSDTFCHCCNSPSTRQPLEAHAIFSTGVNLRKYLHASILIDQMTMRQGIVAQLAEAMAWLHASKVAHLDMKPGNLLWEAQACSLVVVVLGMSLKLSEDGTPWGTITPFTPVIALPNSGAHQ